MIFISGSLAYDRIMNFPGYFRDHILPEKIHVLSVSFLIDRMEEYFGGTAGNIAYTLSLLQERSTILASAGNDFSRYATWLRKHKVALTFVAQHKNVETAAAYIMTDKADNQITAFHPGAMGRKYQVSSIRYQVLKTARMAIVSPGNIDDMCALPRLYKKYDVPYVYDPGQMIPALTKHDLQSGIHGAKALLANDYEMALIQKKTGWGKKTLRSKTAMLVTTFGEKGSVIETQKHKSTKTQKHRIPAVKPKKIIDPTGAGDAYRAGFLFGLLREWPLPVVGRFASLVAVYAVEKRGTQQHAFTWKALRRRYRENFRTALPTTAGSAAAAPPTV